FVNPRHDLDMEVDCSLRGIGVASGQGRILHDSNWNACNTFENPNQVVPQPHPVTAEGSRLRLDLPRLSVATVTLQYQ
ncbi:MAG: alpha-L-arabinofuranosidase C-terminal domain-containing protein, partial [Terriglobia bacterium]